MTETNDIEFPVLGDGSGEPLSRGESRRRAHHIDRFLVALGTTWASTYLQELSHASRNIEGGWPGRLAEARSLVLRELPRELAARGMAAPSARELEDAPGRVNEHARSEWLRVGKAQRLARRTAP
jgi:hypothetical protein